MWELVSSITIHYRAKAKMPNVRGQKLGPPDAVPPLDKPESYSVQRAEP